MCDGDPSRRSTNPHSPFTHQRIHTFTFIKIFVSRNIRFLDTFSVVCEGGKKRDCLVPVAVYASMVIDNTMKIMYHDRDVMCHYRVFTRDVVL